MKKKYLKLTLGFILTHFLSTGHACKRISEDRDLDNPTKKPKIERIKDSVDQKALTFNTQDIVHGDLDRIEKNVEKSINDNLPEDVLKLIFQNPEMVKPTGTICKFWEKLRTDPCLGIQVSICNRSQFSHFLKSSYPKSHIKFNYNISDIGGELTHLSSYNVEIKSLSVIAPSLNSPLTDSLKLQNLSPLNKFTNLRILKFECFEDGNAIVIDMLTTLRKLNLRYSTIKNIPALTNLQALDLFQCNSIHDFSDLNKFIHLRRLDLGMSQFKDVSVISHLTNLQELKLEQCLRVKDISPLSNLGNLKMLDLSLTKMPVPGNLSGLRSLIYKNSPVIDISDFKNLPNLRLLVLENSQIKTTPILTNLQVLDLFGCESIEDFSDLRKLTNLSNLNLRFTKFTNIFDISNLTNLQILNLFKCTLIVDFSGLNTFMNLRRLHLGKTHFKNVSHICNLTNLEKLGLTHCNEIKDTSLLSNFVNLSMLDLTATGISVSQTIPHLPHLQTLILQDVKPVDRTILVHNLNPKFIEKDNLEKINLQKILVTDIFPMNNCPNLRILDVSGNWIQDDISGLSRLTNLTELHIKLLCMTLTNADFAPLKNNLPNLRIMDTVDFF